MRKREFWLLLALMALIVNTGCFSQRYENATTSPIKIIVYADKLHIAEKVAMCLEDEPNFQLTPTDDFNMLDSITLREFDAVIMVPLQMPQLTNFISLSLKSFVYDYGSGIVGISEVISEQNTLQEIFGGSAEISPTDMLKPKLTIDVLDPESSPITYGIPKRFTLVGERPVGVRYTSGVKRLLDMSYNTVDGKTKAYCAGWSYRYGKGKTFLFAPASLEETRYNPYILRMISNAVRWIAEKED